jgi:hypothetical protein
MRIPRLVRAALLPLVLVPALAQAQATLGMAEVKTLIAEKTVDIHNLSTGLQSRAFYAASGELIVQRADAMEFSGRWSVRPDGALCVYFDVESCGSLSKNADGTYTRTVGGKPAFTWLKVTPGKDF